MTDKSNINPAEISDILAKFPVARFLLPILISGILTTFSLQDKDLFSLFGDANADVYLVLISLFFASVAVRLFSISHNISIKKEVLLSVLILGLIGFINFTNLSAENSVSYTSMSHAILLVGCVALLFASPYILKSSQQSSVAFYQFSRFIIGSSLSATIIFALLYIGILAFLLAMDLLFDATLNEDLIFNIFKLITFFIAPIWVLAKIPQNLQYFEEEKECNRIVAFLFNFVIAPLSFLYTLLLATYIAKIILTWELPRGQASAFIIIFSFMGLLTAQGVNILKDKASIIIHLFARYFYYILPIFTMMLFVAIFKRIGEYGLTEARFIVLLLGVFFMFSSIYMLLPSRRQAKNLVLIFAMFAVFTSFGFWGLTGASLINQKARLESLLAKHNILVDGNLNKLQGEERFALKDKDKDQIRSILKYILERDGQYLADIFPIAEGEISSAYYRISYILAELGLEPTEDLKKNFEYCFKFGQLVKKKALDVKNFDYMAGGYWSVGHDEGASKSIEGLSISKESASSAGQKVAKAGQVSKVGPGVLGASYYLDNQKDLVLTIGDQKLVFDIRALSQELYQEMSQYKLGRCLYQSSYPPSSFSAGDEIDALLESKQIIKKTTEDNNFEISLVLERISGNNITKNNAEGEFFIEQIGFFVMIDWLANNS